MNKVLNPFYEFGKTAWKGVKIAGLSAAGVGAYAASEHFLVELLPVIIDVAAPEPYSTALSLLLASTVAGASAAVLNFKKHYKVTPAELEAKIKANEAVQGAL